MNYDFIFAVTKVTILQINKTIQFAAKLLIAGLALFYIIFKFVQDDNLPEAFELFKHQIQNAPAWLLIPILIGIPLNWFFEILKWKLLVEKTAPLTFKQATAGVISGLTMAMLTPNRVGEAFTRVFILPREKRPEGIAYSGINILAQAIVVQVLGIAGLLLLVFVFSIQGGSLDFISSWMYVLGAAIPIVLITALFNTRWISWILQIIRIEKKFPGISTAMASLKVSDKMKTLSLSTLKYLTHSMQFFLLLIYFGLDWDYLPLFAAIMTFYLFLNLIPVIAIGEPGVRGSVALLILSQNSSNDLGILSAALLLWVINIAIPAIIGSILLKKIRF